MSYANSSQQQTGDSSKSNNDNSPNFSKLIFDKVMKYKEDNMKDMLEAFDQLAAVDISSAQQRDGLFEYKADFVKYLGEEIKNLDKPESPKFSPECLPETVAVLLDSEKNMKELISHCQTELETANVELNRLNGHISSLQEICEMRKTQGEMMIKNDFEAISQKALRMFRSEKNDLAELVNIVFNGDDGMQSILADLCNAYFNSDDPYLETDLKNGKYIEILLRASIIERHPYDIKKDAHVRPSVYLQKLGGRTCASCRVERVNLYTESNQIALLNEKFDTSM